MFCVILNLINEHSKNEIMFADNEDDDTNTKAFKILDRLMNGTATITIRSSSFSYTFLEDINLFDKNINVMMKLMSQHIYNKTIFLIECHMLQEFARTHGKYIHLALFKLILNN